MNKKHNVFEEIERGKRIFRREEGKKPTVFGDEVKKKVYCKDCRYYTDDKVGFGGQRIPGECNKVIGSKDTPITKELIYGDCKVLNKDNTCKYYKEPKQEVATLMFGFEFPKKKKWYKFW